MAGERVHTRREELVTAKVIHLLHVGLIKLRDGNLAPSGCLTHQVDVLRVVRARIIEVHAVNVVENVDRIIGHRGDEVSPLRRQRSTLVLGAVEQPHVLLPKRGLAAVLLPKRDHDRSQVEAVADEQAEEPHDDELLVLRLREAAALLEVRVEVLAQKGVRDLSADPFQLVPDLLQLGFVQSGNGFRSGRA